MSNLGLERLKTAATRLEGWWFDVTRRVHTSAGGEAASDIDDFFAYLPTRPSKVRKILRDLPLSDYADYTFIDLGSGKGRVLLVAAEQPFRTIEGVEYDPELHRQAEWNIRTYTDSKRPKSRITSQNLDAAVYSFPAGNLVVYLFNPFGPRVLRKVLVNLAASARNSSSSIFLALANPAPTEIVEEAGPFRLFKQTPGYSIYSVELT